MCNSVELGILLPCHITYYTSEHSPVHLGPLRCYSVIYIHFWRSGSILSFQLDRFNLRHGTPKLRSGKLCSWCSAILCRWTAYTPLTVEARTDTILKITVGKMTSMVCQLSSGDDLNYRLPQGSPSGVTLLGPQQSPLNLHNYHKAWK